MKSNTNMTNLAAQEAVLGTNLRKLRLSKRPRLTQEKLADKLGVPANDLYQERSENPPDTAVKKATA